MQENVQLKAFIGNTDHLALFINQKANELYHSLLSLDGSTLGNSNEYLDYFSKHHLGPRLFFSIQNSAHILYEGIKLTNKKPDQINAIDYGAGLGTLFMLGGLLGFKRFDYNDHLPEWQPAAAVICNAVGIKINHYNIGDIADVLNYANNNKFKYDLVVSRNVVEHIYDLHHFYQILYQHNSQMATMSTTTANFHNPAMHLYHIYIHRVTEKKYFFNSRMEAIKQQLPHLNATELQKLTKLTRGLGQQDFTDALDKYKNGQALQLQNGLGTNTCDYLTGVWSEHLLSKRNYKEIALQAGCELRYSAGYWDTHYPKKVMNILAVFLNSVINLLGSTRGIWISPFVNIATFQCEQKTKNNN